MPAIRSAVMDRGCFSFGHTPCRLRIFYLLFFHIPDASCVMWSEPCWAEKLWFEVVSLYLQLKLHPRAFRFESNKLASNDSIIEFSVVNQKYKIQVHDEYVMGGNTAVLKCQVRYLNDLLNTIVVNDWSRKLAQIWREVANGSHWIAYFSCFLRNYNGCVGAELYVRIRYGDGLGSRFWHALISQHRHRWQIQCAGQWRAVHQQRWTSRCVQDVHVSHCQSTDR